MDGVYLEETRILNFNSPQLKKTIEEHKWTAMDPYDRIGAVYDFVQNDIRFGYSISDILTAEQVLLDGYGQCNTKASLLMALLRGVEIPCRLHGFEVASVFQRGVTSALISAFAPSKVTHTWAEAYYNGQWLALEGVITDKRYFDAVRSMYPNAKAFQRFAIATDNLSSCSIAWKGGSTFVQSAAIVSDFVVYPSPDVFFETHGQTWAKTIDFFYVHFGRKIMNKNVDKIRNRNSV